MTMSESETVDHPRKLAEKTQNIDSYNTIKLSSNQLNYKGQFFNHTTKQTDHQQLPSRCFILHVFGKLAQSRYLTSSATLSRELVPLTGGRAKLTVCT